MSGGDNFTKPAPLTNTLMNQPKDNYPNHSNDTLPDLNQIGHILTRDQIDDLEMQAI